VDRGGGHAVLQKTGRAAPDRSGPPLHRVLIEVPGRVLLRRCLALLSYGRLLPRSRCRMLALFDGPLCGVLISLPALPAAALISLFSRQPPRACGSSS
jgi:hypothetical protein